MSLVPWLSPAALSSGDPFSYTGLSQKAFFGGVLFFLLSLACGGSVQWSRLHIFEIFAQQVNYCDLGISASRNISSAV